MQPRTPRTKSAGNGKISAKRTAATKPRARRAGPGGYGKIYTEQKCPLCAGHLIRIRRRFVDRLLSLFVPVHRYRCPAFTCQWEDNIRVRPELADSMTVSPR
jgi:hypothetical protein